MSIFNPKTWKGLPTKQTDSTKRRLFVPLVSHDRYGPLAWQSAVLDVQFTGARLSAVRIKPLVLVMEGEARGAPYLAQGGEAGAILVALRICRGAMGPN
jgi:hypothetical protein